MARAIELSGTIDAVGFRCLAARSCDAGQSRRLLALAAIAEGRNRAEAARIGGMDRQTLRDWVHRFNAEGVDGLRDRKAPGAARKLTVEQRAVLVSLIETGPDPETDGVVRWRRVDLQAVIQERFGVGYHERSVSRLLHELGFSHLSARPRHPSQDARVMTAFKKTSPTRSLPR